MQADFKRRTERLSSAIRLAVFVAAGGLLLLRGATLGVWLGFLAVLLLAAWSCFLLWPLRITEIRRRQITGWIRIVEVAAISAAALSLPGDIPFCWVLGSALLLAEAIASRDRRRVIAFASLLGVTSVLGELWHTQDTNYAIVAAVTVLASAIIALGLARFHVEEQAQIAKAKRLTALLACGAGLSGEEDQSTILPRLLSSAVRESGGTCGYVLIGDDRGGLRVSLSCGGSQYKLLDGTEIVSGASVISARTGQIINRLEEHPDGIDHGKGLHAIASIPLVARMAPDGGIDSGEVLYGTLTVVKSEQEEVFDSADVDLLKTFASLISVSISNARMESRLRTAYVRSLEALVRTLEARDEYTRGHSERVCQVSMLLAQAMLLSAREIEELRVGSLLHDVGKIGVPDDVLNKPGRLTPSELAIMKSHPLVGYEICKPLGLNDEVLLLIRNHHEWLDGSGYPDALTAESIPLPLRIISVADAWDAMSSRRPYREMLSPDEIFEELESEAGWHFDPRVIACLRALFDGGALKMVYPDIDTSSQTRAA